MKGYACAVVKADGLSQTKAHRQRHTDEAQDQGS